MPKMTPEQLERKRELAEQYSGSFDIRDANYGFGFWCDICETVIKQGDSYGRAPSDICYPTRPTLCMACIEKKRTGPIREVETPSQPKEYSATIVEIAGRRVIKRQ